MLIPTSLLLLVSVLSGAVSQPTVLDNERYELGRRLRAMEQVWEAAQAQDKARALPHLKLAVDAFFRLKLEAAALGLDTARFALEDLSSASPEAWAAQFVVDPELRFHEAKIGSQSLSFQISSLYESDVSPPDEITLTPSLVGEDGSLITKGVPVAWTGAGQASGLLALEDVPEGDHRLAIEIATSERIISKITLGVSFSTKLPQRLALLTKAVAELPSEPTIESSTATHLLEQLNRLAEGQTLETDVPAASLLVELEALHSHQDKAPFYSVKRAGEQWLRVPLERGSMRMRLFSPASNSDALRPCVVALHGAGGSENLFFEGYGDGAAIRLAQARGWVLIAPRAPFFGGVNVTGLLNALAERYQIDRRQVVIVGHSMGAGHGLAAARKDPSNFAALAVIGGGRPSPKDAALEQLPIYITAGSEDFGLAGAQALHSSLMNIQGNVHIEIREGIEHLTIVQETLPAAFRFFDSALGSSRQDSRPPR
jgi:predicted esterase